MVGQGSLAKVCSKRSSWTDHQLPGGSWLDKEAWPKVCSKRSSWTYHDGVQWAVAGQGLDGLLLVKIFLEEVVGVERRAHDDLQDTRHNRESN